MKNNQNYVIYSKSNEFLNSDYAKGSIKNNKLTKQNNTGLYFENIIRTKLSNSVPKQTYIKLNNRTYIPDIETNKSVISCKIQESTGTAYQKLPCELMYLECISKQTNKQVIMLYSDYSYIKYFHLMDCYLDCIRKMS